MSALPVGDIPIPAELAAGVGEPGDDLLDRWFDNQILEEADGEKYVPDAVQQFKVTDDRRAEWAMRKLVERNAEMAELVERRDEWVARITQWFDRRAAKVEFAANYFDGLLRDYGHNMRVAGQTTGHIVLPSGTIRTRESSPVVQVEDEAAVLEWAESSRPDIVVTTKKVPVTALRGAAAIVERPTLLLMAPCGHEVDAWLLDRNGRADAVTCPTCNADALVGDWLAVEYVPMSRDGEIVPGVTIDGPTITVTVSAS